MRYQLMACLLVFAAVPIPGQTAAFWDDRARQAERSGNLLGAETALRRALQSCTGDGERLTATANLMEFLSRFQRLTEARPLASEVERLAHTAAPTTVRRRVAAMHCLAAFYLDDGQSDAAQTWFRRALALADREGLPAVDHAPIRNSIAVLLLDSGHAAQARSILEPLVKDESLPASTRVVLLANYAGALASLEDRRGARDAIQQMLHAAEVETLTVELQWRTLDSAARIARMCREKKLERRLSAEAERLGREVALRSGSAHRVDWRDLSVRKKPEAP